MFKRLTSIFLTDLKNVEEGQDLAEYGLLVGFIALIVLIGASLLGQNLLTYFQNLATWVTSW
jgi:Flp pilus assembly pilin Flp